MTPTPGAPWRRGVCPAAVRRTAAPGPARGEAEAEQDDEVSVRWIEVALAVAGEAETYRIGLNRCRLLGAVLEIARSGPRRHRWPQIIELSRGEFLPGCCRGATAIARRSEGLVAG